MIFRLSVFVAILALVAGQRPAEDERNSQEVSARLMQATDGVSGINSNTAGTVTVIARSTLGGEAVQNGSATQILTQWGFRWVIQDGVREGQRLTGVGLHCDVDLTPTSVAPQVDSQVIDISADIGGVLDGGIDFIGVDPATVNLLATDDNCYLNFTSDDYPSGELRANLACNLATTDSGELTTCISSANTLMVSAAVVLSSLVGLAALF